MVEKYFKDKEEDMNYFEKLRLSWEGNADDEDWTDDEEEYRRGKDLEDLIEEEFYDSRCN